MFCLINMWPTQEHTGFKFLDMSEFCCHLHETGTKSDRYENFSSPSSNGDEVSPV